MPEILGRRVEYEQPWLAVVAKDVDLGAPRGVETFYGVTTRRYAAVVALTVDGQLPLVRQFRAIVEAWTLELPSGIVEPDEDPEVAVRRELLEETGCRAAGVAPLVELFVDPGRMATVQHGFVAVDVEVVAAPHGEEQDLEAVFVDPREALELAARGELANAGHVALLGLAAARGLLG